MPRVRDDVAKVRCPYCFERVELYVDPDTDGALVEDCAVCCRPWTVVITRDDRGQRSVEVGRAQ